MKKLIVLLIGLSALSASAIVTNNNFATDLSPSAATTPQSYNYGSEEIIYVSFVTTAAVTNGTELALAKVPAFSRIIGGEIDITASGVTSTNTLGFSAVDLSGYVTLDGSTTADDPDGFLTVFSTENAMDENFAIVSESDANAGLLVEKDTYILLDGAAGSAALPIGETITLIVRYIR